MNPKGIITIALEGVSLEQTERLREAIHTLIEERVFSLRNGRAILHFDQDGILSAIDFDFQRWRRGKPPRRLDDLWKNATIELIYTPTHTKSGNQ